MSVTRNLVRPVLLAALMMSAAFGSGTANAAPLNDYLWERRPLLLFAPSAADPRLVEAQRRVDADRCAFVDRDMVLGVVVADGPSTLDGQAMDAADAQRLADRYGIAAGAFTAVLVGKDGAEKWRVDAVPDLRTVFAVIDGMPMRAREMNSDAGRC
jgi:hypothetical protein